MVIVGTFKQSIELEEALAVLEKKYVSRDQILVVFMDEPSSPIQIKGRTRSIRSNAFEVGLASATGCAVIGASIGFRLTLGPILWGLIATFIGFAIGYSLYYFINKNKNASNLHKDMPQVTVIIRCDKHQSEPIKETFMKYQAITVGSS